MQNSKTFERGFHNLPEIRDSIHYLFSQLGPHNLHLTKSDFPAPSSGDTLQGDREIAVQGVAKSIATYLGLSVRTITVTPVDSLPMPGRVQLHHGEDFFIELQPIYLHNLRRLVAVLGHELTHILLHKSNLQFEPNDKNEILTDTAAVYFGLGLPMLHCFQEDRTWSPFGSSFVSRSSLGYLTPDEVAYLLARRSLHYNIDYSKLLLSYKANDAYEEGMKVALAERRRPPFSGSGFVRRFIYARKRGRATRVKPAPKSVSSLDSYKFEVQKELQLVFKCRVCFQQLRVPAYRRLIKVKCPTCLSIHRCET